MTKDNQQLAFGWAFNIYGYLLDAQNCLKEGHLQTVSSDIDTALDTIKLLLEALNTKPIMVHHV